MKTSTAILTCAALALPAAAQGVVGAIPTEGHWTSIRSTKGVWMTTPLPGAPVSDSNGMTFIDGYGILILPTTGRYFQIPYRNLLPKKVENLLVAGRATGGDRDSHAATRNMACCAVTGQAAGIAAAISIKQQNQPLAQVDPLLIQKELERQGGRHH